ncbi:MAG: DUF4297 domain-containing protein [Planctomycetaceae bacterium]|nr:DUF4297 domain-containing protein [Planctomycetaceae bacterium]
MSGTQNSLAERLVSVPLRETSGSRSSNRFDFQENWALCHILELHESGNDYVVILDFHDDVVVLDSVTDPSAILFYQIKTKQSGNWKCSDLTYRKKGKSGPLPSILGKLYSNYALFPDDTAGLKFISNAGLNSKLATGGSSEAVHHIRVEHLDVKEQQKIRTKLIDECGDNVQSACEPLLSIERTSLSLGDHTNHALGRLTAFLDSQSDLHTQNSAAFYRTLKGEISRLAKSEEDVSEFGDLCKFKAITRERFSELLETVRKEQPEPDWPTMLHQQLISEGRPFADSTGVSVAAGQFVFHRVNPEHVVVVRTYDAVSKHAETLDIPDSTLWEAIEYVRNACSEDLEDVTSIHGINYARALTGVVIYEKHALPYTNSLAEDTDS